MIGVRILKIIEVCEGCSSAGIIKRYQEERKENNMIIAFSLFLSIGNIRRDREKFLSELCPEINFHNSNEEALKKLLINIDENTNVRIWSSKKNSDDYLLLMYLCNLLKDKCLNISVIYTDEYSEYAWSLNALDYKEIYELLKYEHKLSKLAIEELSKTWTKLVEENGDLRVVENGKVLNKTYADFDNIILNKLVEIGKCKICNLIASLMIEFVINDAGDLIYMYLIDRLIRCGKIKIIDEGDRHFTDIIEVV